MLIYEKSLDQDAGWALSEGSRFFEEKSAVQDALRKITQRLNSLNIPYSIVGGMALFSHGFRRFTEDVDILVRPEDLKRIHQSLEGRGYLPPFHGSKNLRDTEFGVRIEFLISGQFPGDGKPKPVAFPDPALVSVEKEGISYININSLIELKLASGLSSAERIKDLGDVQELIKLFGLKEDFADLLNDYVKDKYLELWGNVNASPKRYLKMWPNPLSSSDIRSLNDLIERLPEQNKLLEALKNDGIQLDRERTATEYICLFTTEPTIAQKYDMHDEAEFWQDEDFAPVEK